MRSISSLELTCISTFLLLSCSLHAAAACTQTAPNGYTCLDQDWPWYGPILGVLFLLVGLVLALRLRIGTWNAFGSLVCCKKDHGVEWESQAYAKRRAAAPQILMGKTSLDMEDENGEWAYDGNDPFGPITDMEIFVQRFTDAELYWLATLRWLKWRWIWDVLRIVGEVLLVFKLLHMYGVDDYNMTGDISWYFVLLPFFLMDGVACAILWQSRSYPLFFCEEYMFKAYCLFAGFPLGSAFKIFLLVALESSHGIHESWFFSIVTVQYSVFLLYVVYLVFWKLEAGRFGGWAQFLCTLALAYVAYTLVNFMRIAWQSEADRHMGSGDYNYNANQWRMSPTDNWAEASLCWWFLIAVLVLVTWSDAALPVFDGYYFESEFFETTRKVPVVVSMTGVAAFLVLVLHHVDYKWSDTGSLPFAWWVFLPLAIAEGLILVLLIASSVYVARHCPDSVWSRKEILKDFRRQRRESYDKHAAATAGITHRPSFYPTGNAGSLGASDWNTHWGAAGNQPAALRDGGSEQYKPFASAPHVEPPSPMVLKSQPSVRVMTEEEQAVNSLRAQQAQRAAAVARASMRHAASQRQHRGGTDGADGAVPHLNHYASRRSSWTGGLYDPASGVQTTVNPLFQPDNDRSHEQMENMEQRHQPMHYEQQQEYPHNSQHQRRAQHQDASPYPSNLNSQPSVRASEMRVNIPAPDYD